MSSMLRRALAAALLFLFVPAPTLAQNKCAGAKLKAACKSAACQAALEAKEAQTDVAIDVEKIAKCRASLVKSFTKSEEKDACVTTGDAASIGSTVDAFVVDLATALDVTTGTNPNKCEGEKIKAAVKKMSCKCGLEAKQAQNGGAIDGVKFTKCETNFDKSFTKSEEKGGCNTLGDTAAIETKVDAFVASLDAALPAVPPTCTPTNGGVEICDAVDNDCDGTADDGNPGGGASCGVDTGECVAGILTCVNGALDCVGDVGPAPETCNDLDDDCDGTVDNGNPGGGAACGVDTGECVAGTMTCVNGALDCVGDVGAATETCNNLDDDCDGVVDDGFDKLTDPQYCNGCAGCNLPHAFPGCSAGNCRIEGCLPGFVNRDGVVANGCEYACTPTGQEVCDGLDNDCDGFVDATDPSLLVPDDVCRSQGACAGTAPTCTGSTGWQCFYGPNVEVQGDGTIVAEETRCDGDDNDCDGAIDEPYAALLHTACADDGTFGTTRQLGACRGTGTLICNAAGTGLRCNIENPPSPIANETCNGIDDDCDGHVDEPYDAGGFLGVRDATVGPLTINGQSVVMYSYEASRPDATTTGAGSVETRACSVVNRLPWADVDYDEARLACQHAGLRLCQVTRNAGGAVVTDEWGRFCEGASNRTFPYGNTFNPTTCNGAEYDAIPGGANDDLAVPTGSRTSCQSQDFSRDQSGNLREWVEDPRTVGGNAVQTLRGGAYDSLQADLTCDNDLTTVVPTSSFANTGFRCCGRACAAGQSDCGGTCVNTATSAANCGGCGLACGAGNICSNGYCCPTGTRACLDQCVSNAQPCP